MTTYRRRRRGEPFTVPIRTRKGPPPGPEILPWYWHPDREGGKQPPRAIRQAIHAFDPDLRAVFSPVHERWLIWVKSPRVQNTLCKGWLLLFIWEHTITKEFLPLGDPPVLLFHNLYLILAHRFPNGKAYYDQVQGEVEKQRAARDKTFTNDRQTQQREWYQHLQISTAGRGNKSALHHNDTFIPSPGELAWREETRTQRLPSAQLKQEAADRELLEYGTEEEF